MPENTRLPVPGGAAARDGPEKPRVEEPRIGIYLCSCGGNISDTVDCPLVARTLEKLPNVVVSRNVMFMCSDPGQAQISEDIRELGVNRVVVGACSPFLHEQTFRRTLSRAGLNPYLYHHVGLREQDSWVHGHHPREATVKAVGLLSAAIAKARRMRPLDPIELGAERQALVVGGGVAGLRAALDLSRQGLQVTLVEKSQFLGGRVARLHLIFPTGEEARELLDGLIGEAQADPRITIHTGAQVVGAQGYVGNFQIRIRKEPRGVSESGAAFEEATAACPVDVPDEFNYGLRGHKAIFRPYPGCHPAAPAIDWDHCNRCGECLKFVRPGDINLGREPTELEIKVGAVVMATGFRPYEPAHGEFGYGQLPEVITLPQLERLLAKDGPTGGELRWAGQPVRSLAMIHCVGSRQVEGLHSPQPDGNINNYCSRVCCTATLSAAQEIHERFPEVDLYDLYQDIRTYGRGHEDYYGRASKNRVTFLRYLAEEPPQVVPAPDGSEQPLLVRVKDRLTSGEEIELAVDLVVLAVGMMPSPVEDLSRLFKIAPGADRFLLEVHPKLRPVETAVTGIVLAGTAQGPMNIQESCAAAQAAASKVAALLVQGKVELEPYVARVDPERCRGAGECVRACPQEDAIRLVTTSLDGRGVTRALVTPSNCNGCGVCVSSCPNRAIDVQGWRLDEYEAMISALATRPSLEEVSA